MSTTGSRRTTYLLAVSCALIVANIYYSQTLVGPISESLGMSEESAGLIVTLTQLGYCAGLLLLVPLADLLENRRLSVVVTIGCAAALLLQGSATSPAMFLLSCSLVGLGSVTPQVLIPLAAHLAPQERRGREVGAVMSGLNQGQIALFALVGVAGVVAAPVADAQADKGRLVAVTAAAMLSVSACFLLTLLPGSG